MEHNAIVMFGWESIDEKLDRKDFGEHWTYSSRTSVSDLCRHNL